MFAGQPSGNAFLDSLSSPARSGMGAAATRVRLRAGDRLLRKGAKGGVAYFPVTALISSIVTMRDGGAVEARVVGREGMAGVRMLLADTPPESDYVTQLEGTALRVSRESLLGLIRLHAELPRVLAVYAETIVGALAQFLGCGRLHHLDLRLARVLLMAHDRVVGDEVGYTQESLARMLGASRSAVTHAANRMKDRGLIRYSRGHIVICDRAALEAAACECYAVVRDRFEELMGFTISKSVRRAPTVRGVCAPSHRSPAGLATVHRKF